MNSSGEHLTTGSIFDDLGRSPEQAANLKIRAALLNQVIAYVGEHGLTQTEAARHFGVPQGRVSLALNGHISKFTIDYLVNMLAHAGVEVETFFVAT